ncbi:MAG: hypothetical protein MGG37_17440, partial [Trichodesmium sp. MAG_R01]|nr:hypothetical protein [Trichodesmium sp. MAG_R01]
MLKSTLKPKLVLSFSRFFSLIPKNSIIKLKLFSRKIVKPSLLVADHLIPNDIVKIALFCHTLDISKIENKVKLSKPFMYEVSQMNPTLEYIYNHPKETK